MWPVVAVKNGSPVARAAAILMLAAADENGMSQGWIAFFEFIVGNESEASSVLSRCEEILANRGAKSLLAPKVDNQLLGLQTAGFNMPQTVLTNHNPPYYQKIFDNCGYQVKSRIVTFNLSRDTAKQAEKAVPGIITRQFNRRNIVEELNIFGRLQSSIFAQSDSYIARNPEQDKEMVASLLPIIDDELIIIAEDSNGQPIGLLICLPDVYQAYKEDKIDRARIVSAGVMPGWERKGIGSLMGAHLMKNLLSKGYQTAEASWILDSNVASQNLAKRFNASPGREFLLFKKDLQAVTLNLPQLNMH